MKRSLTRTFGMTSSGFSNRFLARVLSGDVKHIESPIALTQPLPAGEEEEHELLHLPICV
jgi:hypothetical protein